MYINYRPHAVRPSPIMPAVAAAPSTVLVLITLPLHYLPILLEQARVPLDLSDRGRGRPGAPDCEDDQHEREERADNLPRVHGLLLLAYDRGAYHVNKVLAAWIECVRSMMVSWMWFSWSVRASAGRFLFGV